MDLSSLLLFLTLFAAPAVGLAIPVEPKPHASYGSANYVLIVGADGMGAYWLTRLPSKYSTPNFNSMRQNGSWTFDARAQMPTISKPNWMSIIAGAGPEEHGVLDNDWVVGTQLVPVTGPNTYFPSIFQQVKTTSNKKVAVYNDWSGFDDLYPKNATDYHYLAPNDPDGLDVTQHLIDEVITGRKANLMYVHYDDVDEAGHGHGWGSSQYWDAVVQVDKLLGMLVTALAKEGILNQTLILLVADHGGEGNGHGETDEKNMFVPFFAMGPQVKPNFRIPSPMKGEKGLNVRSMDIAPTGLNALGIPAPPFWIGRVVQEIYA